MGFPHLLCLFFFLYYRAFLEQVSSSVHWLESDRLDIIDIDIYYRSSGLTFLFLPLFSFSNLRKSFLFGRDRI